MNLPQTANRIYREGCREMQRDADFYRWLLGGTKVLFTVTFRGFLRYFAGVEIF